MIKLISAFIKKVKQDTKIANKFIAFIIILDFIPLFLLTIVVNGYFKGVVKNEAISSYNMVMNQYIGNIQYKVKVYNYMIDSIVANNALQDVFFKQKEYKISDTIDLSILFSDVITNVALERDPAEIYGITLYAMDENFPIDGKYISNIKYAEDTDWFKKIRMNLDKINLFYYTVPGSKQGIFSISKPIYDYKGSNYSEKLGFVKIDLYSNKIFNMDDATLSEKNAKILIFDNDNNIVYQKDKDMSLRTLQKDIDSILKMQQGDNINDDTGKTFMVLNDTIASLGLRVVAFFPYDQVESRVSQISGSMILAEILIFIFMVAFTLTFFEHISKRLRMLVKKIVDVGNGNLEVTDVIEGKDEIGIVDDHFNLMVTKLKASIHDNYIQRLEKREAELHALQLQINPHFLYNTLESINAISYIYRCKEISVISQSLGDMFRYSIDSGKGEFVALKEEIQHVQNYLEIQKIRFDEMFNVSYDISDDLLSCRIIKFILQPIIENSFYHGFYDKKGAGHIVISAVVENGYLLIRVQDDGIGMTEKQLEDLVKHIGSSESSRADTGKKSIGLKNVNHRIKLLYGEQFGLKVSSTFNEGTIVTISLPFNNHLKRDAYVQDSDY